MLIDILAVCAPLVLALPAAAAVLISRADLRSSARSQKQLYATLLLVEKLPAGIPGGPLIHQDVDRQTLHLAYLTRYPHRSREIVHLAVLGVVVLALVAVCYVVWWRDATLVALLVALGALALAALGFERALLNFGHNDELARELFVRLGAPAELSRRRTPLVRSAPKVTADTVLQRAADIRDAGAAPMTTVEAVNAVLAEPDFDFDWRREVRRAARRVGDVDYRAVGADASVRAHAASVRTHDWLMRRVGEPFFVRRLRYLEMVEHHRVTKAHRTGDVYRAAWLVRHYRDERARVDAQRAQLDRIGKLSPADVRTHVGNMRSSVEATARRISASARPSP